MAAQLDLNVVPTHNPKTIGIADMSIYDENQVISAPTIEVTPPGFGKVAIPFSPNEVNVLNSNNLKLTATLDASGLVPLPDGIWQLKYSIQPALENFVQRKFFRTDQIQCKYYQIFLTVDMTECESNNYCLPKSGQKPTQEQKLREIELMINGAISAANRGEDLLAMQMYNRANQMIDRFNVCKTC